MTDTGDIAIEREDDVNGGRYVMRYPDGSEGEMTYRRVRPGVISIYHTETPDQHRGHGHALMMVERGIADARAEGNKVIPSCSYVAAQFRRHPDWEDLRA